MKMRRGAQVQRFKQGLARWELAQKLGIDPQKWEYYEMGRRSCPDEVAQRAAAILGMPVEELFLPVWNE